MHIFDYDRTLESLLSPEIIALIAEIHEYKGRQDYLLNAKDEVLDALAKVSREKSVMSSNRIDGVSTPEYRIRDLFDEDAEPRNENEQAICAYRKCFTHVLANYGTMQPTPDSIRALHGKLFARLPSGAGACAKQAASGSHRRFRRDYDIMHGMLSALLICSLAFAESKALAVQICLDRAGCSCNTIDGQWGAKSQRALEAYCSARRIKTPPSPEAAYDALFAGSGNIFRIATVTPADIAAITPMPSSPAEKARLPRMGYGSVLEMFAERGHLSRRAMERMNPGVDWARVSPGLKLVIPAFPSMEEELSVWPKDRANAPKRPEAALVKVSLSRFEITAYDAHGRLLALFPCSIAQNKAKLPRHGELRITDVIANPNYTYTPDHAPRGGKAKRYVFPEGPRCPVGVAWLGLSLPGYGIHGTPRPESIGSAESHGCFRLSNWNAARLYALCRPGVKVVVEK